MEHTDTSSQMLPEGSGPIEIVGESPEIKNLKQTAEKLAKTSLAILIEGESGTGKSLFAQAIHRWSDRAGQPFVSVSFAALTQPQMESRLFGCGEGGKDGLLRQAAGGTLFLDGIENMSLETQAKFLQILQNEETTAASAPFSSLDIRMISSAGRNLAQMASTKLFRKELLYRLKEGYLYLPPLSERKADIPLLAEYWQRTMSCTYKPVDTPAVEILTQHNWPGNVRELFNVMKFAAAVNERQVITKSDLPYDILRGSKSKAGKISVPQTDRGSLIILSAIHEINHHSGIAGRSRIYWYLKDNGHEISEYKIRKTIPLLITQGLVADKPGKYGLSLTDKGIMVLETQYYQ